MKNLIVFFSIVLFLTPLSSCKNIFNSDSAAIKAYKKVLNDKIKEKSEEHFELEDIKIIDSLSFKSIPDIENYDWFKMKCLVTVKCIKECYIEPLPDENGYPDRSNSLQSLIVRPKELGPISLENFTTIHDYRNGHIRKGFIKEVHKGEVYSYIPEVNMQLRYMNNKWEFIPYFNGEVL